MGKHKDKIDNQKTGMTPTQIRAARCAERRERTIARKEEKRVAAENRNSQTLYPATRQYRRDHKTGEFAAT